MTPSRKSRAYTLLVWIFILLMIASTTLWMVERHRLAALPPAVPGYNAARQTTAQVAPPKEGAVGRHVMAAIQANEKDVKKPTNPPQ